MTLWRNCFIGLGRPCARRRSCGASAGVCISRKVVGERLFPVISSLTAPQGFVFSRFRSAGRRMHGLFRWSGKWWRGTIPLAILWGLACWSNTLLLESDLTTRSTAALKDAVLDKTQIAVDGRDVTLSADAFSESGRHDAVASVAAVRGVRLG